MIVAEDPPRYSDETTEYCDGLNQVAAVILAAKKMLFVNGLRGLKSEVVTSILVILSNSHQEDARSRARLFAYYFASLRSTQAARTMYARVIYARAKLYEVRYPRYGTYFVPKTGFFRTVLQAAGLFGRRAETTGVPGLYFEVVEPVSPELRKY